MSAVRSLQQAAKEVQKHSFPSQRTGEYTYVNTKGASVLNTLKEMREEVAQLRKENRETFDSMKMEAEESEVKLKKMREESEVKLKKMREESEVKFKKMREESEVNFKKMREESKVKSKKMREESEVESKKMREESEVKFKKMREESEVKFKKMREESEVKSKKMREESEVKFKKMREESKVKSKKMREESKGRIKVMKREIAELRMQQLKHAEWATTMQPLQETAIAIRRRFFENYLKLIGVDCVGGGGTAAIRIGNRAAHNGDVLTDTVLITQRHITDTDTFYDLYGIYQHNAQLYLKSDMMIKIINKRATILANPDRHSKQWNRSLQQHFKRVLAYFNNANREDRNKFEAGNVSGLPATRSWLRIVFV